MKDLKYINQLITENIHLDEVEASESDLIIEHFIAEHLPVKVKGLAEDWKTNEWTLDFFKENKGDLRFPVRRKNMQDQKDEEKEMALKEYIQYMLEVERQPVENPYYLNTTFSPTVDMLDDYQVPDYFKCYFDNFRNIPDKTTLSWIYLAPKYSITGLHIDVIESSAWNLVISGKKFWVFYPKEQNPYLYAGAVNPFAPDTNKHPLYQKAEPMVCVQNPGEIIFTPSGWYHAVLNLETGISLTENFINEYNIDAVRSYCKAVGIDTGNLEQLYKVV